MSNTLIHYEYRDAANYRRAGYAVLTGPLDPSAVARMRAACNSDGMFVPDAVGLPTLVKLEDWDDDLDHAFHIIEDIEPTTEAATDGRGLAQLADAFESADWDASAVQFVIERA